MTETGESEQTEDPSDRASRYEESIEVSEGEERRILEQSEPRLPVTFEVVRRDGAYEQYRPAISLWWSGLAAGSCIGLSVLAQAILASYLPETDWARLIEKAGYSLGFLVVILAGQQLFTEITLTAVAPFLLHPSRGGFYRLMRLWSIVLLANVCGATLFGALVVLGRAMSDELIAEILVVSEHAMSFSGSELAWRGLVAGFLIALLVWIRARTVDGQVLMIVLITWLIAAGDFAHIIAGSAEAAILLLSQRMSPGDAVFGFFVPTLVGNVIGGTALFAALAYAQIKNEIRHKKPPGDGARAKRSVSDTRTRS
ncbi:MAG: formate/nitrite transporter family protein [Burkholderiaceae bacterium]